MVEKDSDWIWEALALGEESLLKDADVEYFDWNSSHDKYGTPFIALVVGKATGQEVYDFATGTPEKLTERLELMKLVLAKGASPHAKPPQQFSICKSWWKTEGDKEVENSRTPLVHFNDKSAYGVVAACLEALTNVEGDWKRELRFLRETARILASYRALVPDGNAMARVPVAEGVVETWERMLSSGDRSDVTIVCRGPLCGGSDSEGATLVPEELAAHAVVLRSASRVLKAMLSPDFREGSTARIEVESDAAAVRLLLSLIYTGEDLEDADATAEVLLSALELAHQWDVSHAVASLEVAAARMIDEKRFGRTIDVAARLHLTHLLSACVTFAKTSPEIKAQARASKFPDTVQVILAKAFGDSDGGASRKKKRRLILHFR